MSDYDEVKLFIDDLRDPPEGWVCVRTNTEAITFLRQFNVGTVSIDHDIMHVVPYRSINIPTEVADKMENLDEVYDASTKLVDVPVACPETYKAVAMFIADMTVDERPHTVIIHTSNPDGGKEIANLLRGRVGTIIMKIGRYNKKGAPWI